MTDKANKVSKLEVQINELLELCKKLGDDNEELHKRINQLTGERSTLIELKEQTRSTVEAMITRLKSMEGAQFLMSTPESVTLKILDKEYRVACDPAEKDSLTASAKMLVERLDEIKNKGSVIGAERIAVMAALNLSHELLTGESLVNEYNDIEQRIDGLSEKIKNTIDSIDSSDSTNKDEAFA